METNQTTKTCTKCLSTKSLNDFANRAISRDGRTSSCIKCDREKVDLYQKTIAGVVSRIYSHQKETSKKRGHGIPAYTRDELLRFLRNDWLFNLLFDNWANCGYHKMYRPSVDRKEDKLGYSFENIQIMTWAENKAKASRDMRSGKLTHGNKPQKKVSQLDKSGKLVKEFVSVSEACRATGIAGSSISSCCNEKLLTAGGFKWKYKL